MAGKKDLTAAVVSGTGMGKGEVETVVEATLDAIQDLLVAGERLSLPGFGTFSVSERSARTGRNPATGATIEIPAKKVAKFKPAKALADAVNN